MSVSRATMIGCPSCAGCLRLVTETHEHCQFECSVGHRFALWDLYKAKETELERAQWSTVVLLKHLETILDMFLESSGIPDAPGQEDLCERQRQVRRQMASIRQLIESTRLPAGHGTDAMASEAVRVDG